MKLKFLATIVFIFSLPVFCVTQSNSFQYKMLIDSCGKGIVAANEHNDIVVQFHKNWGPEYNFIVKLQGNLTTCFGYSYHNANPIFFGTFSRGNSAMKDNTVFLTEWRGTNGAYSHLLSLDLNSGNYWCKRFFSNSFSISSFPSFTLSKDGNIYVANALNPIMAQLPNYPKNGILEFYKLNQAGDLLWKNGLYLKEGIGGDSLKIAGRGIVIDDDYNIYTTGLISNLIFPSTLNNDQFLIKIDSTGGILALRRIHEFSSGKMVLATDGIYLLDKKVFPDSWEPNDRSAVILKFDFDLNFRWAKKYFAENFSFSAADLLVAPDGNLLLTCASIGAYPVIFTKLDSSGNILNQKGYSSYMPTTLVLSDGSLVISSPTSIENTANGWTSPVIAKTDVDGNVDGCFTLPTCLESKDTMYDIGTLYAESYPVVDLQDEILIMTSVSFGLTPYCNDLPPPLPTFTFPDTLCLGASATTLSDRNRLAQAREWQLTGPGSIDSLLRDSFEFRYTFSEPGEYLLRQSVWVLGCRSDYERSITVLPPLTVAIAADSLLCPDEPQEISAQANRTANYTWNKPMGASGQTLPLTASGTYTVTATDGHCEATDSATVTVADALLNGQLPFTLPPDTTICHRDLPFLLTPHSAFSNVFLFENGAVQATSYSLTEAGTYKVGMEVFGCEFQQTFRLKVDCHADVYLPNSFSPNNDGINDSFGPLGTDFEVLELSIYDRWGSKVHQSQTAWDGGRSGQGVYAYKLVYKDLLNLETVTLNGEVILVK